MKQASLSNIINTICSTDALLKEAEHGYGYDSGIRRLSQTEKENNTENQRIATQRILTLTIPYVPSAFRNDIKRAIQTF